MKKYDVETGNEQIVCKIQQLTEPQTKLLLGTRHYPTFARDKNNKSFPTQECSLPRRYVATKVIIENKSEESIYLSNDEYIKEKPEPLTQENANSSTGKPFFVLKKVILEKLPNFPKEQTKNLLLMTIPMAIVALSELTFLPRLDEDFRNSEDQEAIGQYLLIRYLSEIAMGLTSLGGVVSYLANLKKISSYEKLASFASLKQIFEDDKNQLSHEQNLSHDLSYFEIPPDSSFVDLFFIPMEKAKNKIIPKTSFQLTYSHEKPNDDGSFFYED